MNSQTKDGSLSLKEDLHCFVCDTSISPSEKESHNIFSKLILPDDDSRSSVFEKMGQILDKPLGSLHIHSDLICQSCFTLLIEYETTQIKLFSLRSEVVAKFQGTVAKHISAKEEREEENVLKEKCKKMKSHRKRIINEEGRVVTVISNECERGVISESKQNVCKIQKKRNNGKQDKNKRYNCPVCRKDFRAYSHRVEHMLIHLGEKPWQCKECNKSFRTKCSLKVHVMRHSGERPYICEKCGKAFKDKTSIEEHSRTHSGFKPFSCNFCVRQFTRKKDLVVHLKTHTDDKPYACALCPKRFAVKSRLERHAMIHSGEKPFVCNCCGKSFARKDDYKVHERQHTGERPFQCEYCDKTFIHQSNRLAHMRTHTGTKKHHCSMCERAFCNKTKLQKHITSHHGGKPSPKENDDQTTDCSVVKEKNCFEHSEGHQITVLEHASVSGLQEVQAVQSVPISLLTQVSWESAMPASSTAVVYTVPATYVNIIN